MQRATDLWRGRAADWCASSVAVLASCSLFASAAAAQPASGEEQAAAQVLFDQGRDLIAKGRTEEACPKFEESQRLDAGVGTQFNLADCYERVGRTASAWTLFLEVAALSKAAGRRDREQVARARADALEPRLAKLTITVAESEAGLRIWRNARPVRSAQWGVAVPVDPGEHAIHVSAPGHRPWETTVTAVAGSAAASVTAPALERVATVQGPSSTPPPAPGRTTASAPQQDTSGGLSTLRIVGLASVGAGVVSVGVATYFGFRAGSKDDQADERCGASMDCTDQQGVDLSHQASTAARVSTGFWVAGAALLAGGVVMVLAAPSGSEAVTLRATAGWDGQRAAIRIGGRF